MKPARPTDTAAPDPRPPAPGIIQGATDTAYSLRALGRVTGLREHGLRQLCALGLPMTTIGRERWVLGEDFIDLVRKLKSGRLPDRDGRAPEPKRDRLQANLPEAYSSHKARDEAESGKGGGPGE